MRYTFAGTVGTCLLASVALAAADFWQEKDFTLWSAQQVEKMLTDSPWAKKVTLVVGSLQAEALGGFQQSGAGLGGGGGGRGTDVGDSEFQRIRRVNVTVAWVSALPMRQALVRRQVGADARIAPDQQLRLGQTEPSYIVAVVGLPLRLAAKGTIDDVKSKTALTPNKKEPIPLEDVRVFQGGDQTVRMEFLFARSKAIAPEDKEVAFSTKLGELEITKKFRLAEMMIGGKLAL